MKRLTGQNENRIKRAEAARLIGVGPATLRRYELRGMLQGFKVNSRLTLYRLRDVLRIANGEVEFSSH